MEKTNPQSNIKTRKKYLVVMIVILALTHILDAIITYAGNYVNSSVINEFLVIGEGMDLMEANAYANQFAIFGLLVMLFGFIFKSMMDKFGRKKMLIVAIIGMSIGNLIRVLSTNYWIFYCGSLFGMYFVAADVQVIYINEEAPKKWRATFLAVIKTLGILGTLIVPFLRGIYITDTSENWRPIYLIPAIMGIVIAILAIIFIKETSVFEETQKRAREGEIIKKPATSFREGVRRLKNSQVWPKLKWINITSMFAMFLAMGFTYTDQFLEAEGISEIDKNVIITWNIIFMAIAWILQGPVADKLGRKPAFYIWGVTFLISLSIEVYAVKNGMLIIAGIFQGLRIGSYWNFCDILIFMTAETAPTQLRGNAIALRGLYTFGSIILAVIVSTILLRTIGDIGMMLIYMGIPSVAIAIVIFALKTVETKGTDVGLIEE
ncbi:MAG: MFS transporter [Promethearchaeota archaeon]